MRTLLTGEYATALAEDSEDYVLFEVQNYSGTWVNVGERLGASWIVNATWSEGDTPIAQATVQVVMAVGSASLAPLMSTSVLNVDDDDNYAPLLELGRLARFSTATMPHGVAPESGDYRPAFTGRIDDFSYGDTEDGRGPISVVMSDLGAWLQDIQIEIEGTEYGTTPVGTPLEEVAQAILDDNIPATEPAVTLLKQSASSFAVTSFVLGATKLLEALVSLVRDSTGEDIRYRFDATHVSRLTWFNPDRTRVSVDGSFTAKQYVVQQLSTSMVNIRNAGAMAFTEDGDSGTVTSDVPASIEKYRRRFFRLPESPMLSTEAEAQTVIDAVTSDLSGPLADFQVQTRYLWFVQRYDRYTFAANGRLFDEAQTMSVVGVQHSITSGRGVSVLTCSGRVVGHYAAWLARLRGYTGRSSAALSDLAWTDSEDNTQRIYTWTRNASTAQVFVYAETIEAPILTNPFDTDGTLPDDELPVGVDEYTITKPAGGSQTFVKFEPRNETLHAGQALTVVLNPAPSAQSVVITPLVTERWAALDIAAKAGISDWPCLLEVFEDSPDGDPIFSATITEDTTFLAVDEPELDARELPDRGLRHWWAKMTNVAGEIVWGTASADRDPLPSGSFAPHDYRADAGGVTSIDDDTDAWRITLPDARTLTISTPPGTNTVSYATGDTLDDASEDDLLEGGETRGEYVIALRGGGTWLEIWRGYFHGLSPVSPYASTRAEANATGTSEDLYARVYSPINEAVRVYFRESDSAGAPLYGLCVSDSDDTPLYVPSGTEVGPTHYFVDDGVGSPLAKFNDIALVRDQLRHIFLEFEGQSSLARSTMRVALSLKASPYLESLSLTWDAAAVELHATAVGGARCVSALLEYSDSSTFATIAHSATISIADGALVGDTYALSGAQLGGNWYVRCTPNNAAAGAGLDGVPMVAEVTVPGVATINVVITSNVSLSVVVDDPAGWLDPTDRIGFYVTAPGGTRTLTAPTSAPGGGATTGTYTCVIAPDEKHDTIVEPWSFYIDGSNESLGQFPFDADIVSDVTATVAYSGGTAIVSAKFDTDTDIGAATGRYRVDGGSWVTFAVGAGLTGSFNVTASATATQLVEVQGQNLAGSWGTIFPVRIDVYAGPPKLDVRVSSDATNFYFACDTESTARLWTRAGVGVTTYTDSGADGDATITVARDVPGGEPIPFSVKAIGADGQVSAVFSSTVAPQELEPLALAIGDCTASDAGAAGPPFNQLDVEFTATGMPTGTTFDCSYNNGVADAMDSDHGVTSPHTFTGVTFSGLPGKGSVTVSAIYNGALIATQTKNKLYMS